ARTHAFTPRIVRESLRKVDIGSSAADTAVGDAGKVRFTADTRPESAFERVIPDCQLGKERSIHRGNKIDGVVRHIHDVLVCTDTVVGRDFVIWQIGTLYLQTQSRMCESDDSALRFAPFQDWKIPRGPALDLPRVGIVLIAEAQKDQMAAMTRRKSRDLDIVAKQR